MAVTKKTLSQARFEDILDGVIFKQLQSGQTPQLTFVLQQVDRILNGRQAGPFLRFRKTNKGIFNVEEYNINIDELHFDLSTLYRFFFLQAEKMLESVESNLALFSNNISILNALNKQMDELILSSQNSEGFNFSVSDIFNDFSRIDRTATTAFIDIKNHRISLPFVDSTATRHDLSKATIQSSKILSEDVNGNNVDLNINVDIPTSPVFFTDEFAGWTKIITLPKDIDPILEVIVRLGDTEIGITSVEFTPMPTDSAKVQCHYSNDGINWLFIPGDNVEKQTFGESINWSGNRVLAQFLRFRINKLGPSFISSNTQPDVNNSATQDWNFSIRNIAAFDIGYLDNAIFQTTPLSIEGKDSIDSVVLNVKHNISGGDIRYFIGPENGIFQEIRPLGATAGNGPHVIYFNRAVRTTRDGSRDIKVDNIAKKAFWFSTGFDIPETAEELVQEFDGGTTKPVSNKVVVDAEPELLNEGIIFKKELGSNRLFVIPASRLGTNNTVVPESVKLWRGRKSWSRQQQIETKTFAQTNEFEVDTTKNIKKLFKTIINERVLDINISTPTQPKFSLKNNVLDSNKSNIERIVKIPSFITLKGTDGVIHVTGISNREILFNASSLVIPIDKDKLLTGRFIHLNYSIPVGVLGDQRTVDGFFEILGNKTINDEIFLKLKDPKNILLNTDTNIIYEILNKPIAVSEITNVNNNEITLSVSEGFVGGDSLRIIYKSPLQDIENVLGSSIRIVRDSSGSLKSLNQGSDYVYNPSTKTIEFKPSSFGSDTKISAIVSFNITQTISGLDIYKTWVHSSEDKDINISITPPILNINVGEQAFIIGKSGKRIDITDTNNKLSVPSGWSQVVVKSMPVLAVNGTTNKDSGLYKVINTVLLSTSNENRKLFSEGNVFNRIIAHFDPLKSVTVSQMEKVISQTDRSFFGVDDFGNIYLNFEPATELGNIYLIPGEEIKQEQHFEIEFNSKPVTGDIINKVVLRAELSRPPSKSSTPFLLNYSIRAG